MLHTISASQISAEMHAISKLNLYIQKDNVLHRKWEKHLSKCTCSYSQDAEEVYDEDHSEHLSSHERLNYWAKKTERNERIIALHDKLMDVGSLRAAGSKLRLIFGLTDAGNPAIQVKIDNMRVHDRPLTPKTLAPILVELADCLSFNEEMSGRVRHFIVCYSNRIYAVSPEQALWKWLCVQHRKQALELIKISKTGSFPDHDSFEDLLKNINIQEWFDPLGTLGRSMGLDVDADRPLPPGW